MYSHMLHLLLFWVISPRRNGKRRLVTIAIAITITISWTRTWTGTKALKADVHLLDLDRLNVCFHRPRHASARQLLHI